MIRYSNLSFEAQLVAVREYIKGWEETHDKGDLDESEADSILRGMDDFYNINGNYLGD